jgi:CheY-like chemotaxis protein
LFGKAPQELRSVELTSLARFDNPSAILEAAFELDQLAASVNGEAWRAPLKSSHVDEEYVLIARKYRKKLNGSDVIEVKASPVVDAAVTMQRRESMRKSREAKREREELPASSSVGIQRVLLVEDSPTSLKLMARMIQRLGHEVMTATNGVDALGLLQNESFDIVLMDINMPLMNGLEASHEFRKLEKKNRASGRPYQKIIAMSGDISSTLFTEVTNAGFDAFIPKPLTEERFYEVLRLPCEHHK